MGSPRMEECKKIVALLKENGVSKVVLVGEAGTGKTWLARCVASEMRKPDTEKGSCYLALWLHLNKKYDEKSLYENIAIQLSLFPEYEETEEDDGKEKTEEEVEDLETLKKKITDELGERKKPADGKKTEMTEKSKEKEGQAPAGNESSSSPEKSYLLLILDDEGSMTKEDWVMKDLKLEDFLKLHHPLKILITRRKGDESSTSCSEERVEKIGLLSEDVSRELLMNESLEDTRKIIDPKLTSDIVKKSMGLPAAIVVLAKSLNCSRRLSPKQERVLEEVALSSLLSEAAAGSESAISWCRDNPILQLASELLKNDDTLNSAISDCFWHSLDFFEHSGAAYYRDLITHWILEGYFDPVRLVEKAYQDGHSILMELINRGILKIQEDNVVVPEVAMSNLVDLRRRGFLGSSHLGFARVYGGDKTKGVGKITQIDDMLKTVQTKKKREKLSTILVSGSRLRREIPKKFFEKPEMQDLEVLGLFEPTFESLVPSLSRLKKLRVLVIRDYDLVDSINELAGLQGLHVLEVSGASSLKEIRDDFFKTMSQLQSLNLSGLRIKSSPSTISKLSELRSLILKDCPELEELPDIQSLTKLEVVDISGACSLKSCSDKDKNRKKSKNKNFAHLQQLELLDLSESQIDRLPIFQDSRNFKQLRSLTRLLLHNCSNLKRLPHLKPLSGLQILDLSGATGLVEMLEITFEDKQELKILNLSGTNLSELPPTIGELPNLSQLLLKNCSKLEVLPNIEKLIHLEVFDVSDCTNLEKIEGSFEHMSYLRVVDLSGTKIKTLPELPEQSNLHCSKRMVLPDRRCLERDDWSKIKEDLQSGKFENSGSSVDDGTLVSDKPIKPDAVTKAREIFEEERGSGGKLSNESHACVCPEKKGECQEVFHRGDGIKALYLTSGLFVDLEKRPGLLEIHGSNDPGGFPDHVKEDLAKAEFVSFVDNYSTSLSSLLDAFQMKAVKSCWLERCKKMETIFSDEHEKHVVSPIEPLETLWISNLPLLKSICSKSLEHGGFKNLKQLSLDCCPSIKTLFPASQLPISLEILHIKFCDQLEKVFDGEREVPNLHTLHLFGLPLLSAVGAKLPKLEILHIKFCDQLEKVFDGEREVPNLHTLHLFGLPLLSAVGAKLPKLVHYTAERCPTLKAKMEDPKQRLPRNNPDSGWEMVQRPETAP